MFANRFTALIDACSLAGVLKRNLLLTLAEAEFFRVRWSPQILDETQRAIAEMLSERGCPNPDDVAQAQRNRMEAAFPEASVIGSEAFSVDCSALPDQNDVHVVTAALQTRAYVIVTDNIKDFPNEFLKPLSLYARSTDAFIADTITLDPGRALDALKRMRERFKKPEVSASQLLYSMEAHGLTETVDVLRPYERQL